MSYVSWYETNFEPFLNACLVSSSLSTVLDLVFVRGFEHALVMLTVIAFLLIMVYMMIKHVKRLPKYYGIEIVDIFGKKTVLDGLRLNFVTYEAAKSYSQFYTNLYGKRYQFHVVGRNRIVDPFKEIVNLLPREKK